MNKLHNEFKTIEEQKEILEERGMIIDNESILEEFNYSHLIYKYGSFYNENNKNQIPKYKENTKISYLKELYDLNTEISMYFYKAIGKIESMLKVVIARFLSKLDPLFWVHKNNFNFPYEPKDKFEKKHFENELDNFIKNLMELNKKRKIKYEPNYLINGFIPIWLMVDEMAFGQLRMILKLSGHQGEILRNFKLYGRNDWKLLIDVNTIRNRTHHYNPILNSENNENNSNLIKNVLKLIRIFSNDDYKKIIEIFNNFDFESINISREKILGNNVLKSQAKARGNIENLDELKIEEFIKP